MVRYKGSKRTMMKHIILGLIALVIISTVVNFISNNTWTQVVLLTVVSVFVSLSIYFAGIYTGVALAERGANIVLRGQEINDKWDAAKIAGMAQFGKELIKVKTDSIQAGQQYPILPPMTQNVFDITDFESQENE